VIFIAIFECNRCGKCCRSFGAFFIIERQMTDRDYYCRYRMTNELFSVHVRSEFADEIAGRYEGSAADNRESGSKGCPFLCKSREGTGYYCSIYSTRPNICRQFKCYRILIRGTVFGINGLRTQDEVLMTIWKNKIAPLSHPVNSRPAGIQDPHITGSSSDSGGKKSHLHSLHGVEYPDDDEWLSSVISTLASHGYQAERVE